MNNDVFVTDAGKEISVSEIIKLMRQSPYSGKLYVRSHFINNRTNQCKIDLCVASQTAKIKNGSGGGEARQILRDFATYINRKLGTNFTAGGGTKFCSHRKILGFIMTQDRKHIFKDEGFAFLSPGECVECKDDFQNNIEQIKTLLINNDGGASDVRTDDDGFLLIEGWIPALSMKDAELKLKTMFGFTNLEIYDIIKVDDIYEFKIAI